MADMYIDTWTECSERLRQNLVTQYETLYAQLVLMIDPDIFIIGTKFTVHDVEINMFYGGGQWWHRIFNSSTNETYLLAEYGINLLHPDSNYRESVWYVTSECVEELSIAPILIPQLATYIRMLTVTSCLAPRDG